MKFSTVIFDWAGTTVDYGCMAPVKAFEKAFAEAGILLTPEQIREPMGMLKVDHIRRLLMMPIVEQAWQEKYGQIADDRDVQRIYQSFENYLFADLAENSQLKPDTLVAVDAIRKLGLKIGSTTGYTDDMMAVVAKEAAAAGYQPDFMVTPDSVDHLGRPFPYMIFENMRHFEVTSVSEVVKVGDTISDIKEGKNAGVYTVGVIEGSSEMGLSLAEYQNLSPESRQELVEEVANTFYAAGADECVLNLQELVALLTGEFAETR